MPNSGDILKGWGRGHLCPSPFLNDTPTLSWTPCNRGGEQRDSFRLWPGGMRATCKGDILSYQSFPSYPSYIVFVVVVLNWCTWPCSLSVLVCSFGCGILPYKAFPPLVMQNSNQRLCIYDEQKMMLLCFLWKYISDLYMEMNISLLYEFWNLSCDCFLSSRQLRSIC